MKILFCVSSVPEEIEFQVRDISAAGNRFQLNMIKNMKKAGLEVIPLSYVGVPVSPEIQKQICGQDVPLGGVDTRVVYKNKGFLQAIRAYRKEMKPRAETADVLLCYNVLHVWMNLPRLAKAWKKKSVLILADYSGPESYKSLVRKLYAMAQYRVIRKFDVVVGLSADTAKKLKKGQKFILMEGGIDEELFRYFEKSDVREETVQREPSEEQDMIFMYSGLLSPGTGVDRLLEAMNRIKDDRMKLIITGKGELEEAVREAAGRDSRILFQGLLQYKEYLDMLKRADVLINPRNMSLPENQNNFPSKIFDYLASGKPILSTRFIGWEKFEEVICFCDDTAEGLSEGLLEMLRVGKGNTKAQFEASRTFAKQFLWNNQIKRLFES